MTVLDENKLWVVFYNDNIIAITDNKKEAMQIYENKKKEDILGINKIGTLTEFAEEASGYGYNEGYDACDRS